MAKGFFVPNSVSSNYVQNQRNEQGNYKWDQATQEVGLGQQAAFQTINKQYSNTINQAYTNYLAANRGVQGSNMGTGYKEAYLQANQQGLAQQVAETNLSAASARSQIQQQGSQLTDQLAEQFQTEVGNMDRVATSMSDYLGYLSSLTGATDASLSYLSDDQKGQSLDTMYETLFNAQPQAYLDAEGNVGMSYVQWVQKNMKSTTADTAWSQWLFGQGGYNQFREATKKGIKPL